MHARRGRGAALAREMTLKMGAFGIPVGGAKGGIDFDSADPRADGVRGAVPPGRAAAAGALLGDGRGPRDPAGRARQRLRAGRPRGHLLPRRHGPRPGRGGSAGTRPAGFRDPDGRPEALGAGRRLRRGGGGAGGAGAPRHPRCVRSRRRPGLRHDGRGHGALPGARRSEDRRGHRRPGAGPQPLARRRCRRSAERTQHQRGDRPLRAARRRRGLPRRRVAGPGGRRPGPGRRLLRDHRGELPPRHCGTRGGGRERAHHPPKPNSS